MIFPSFPVFISLSSLHCKHRNPNAGVRKKIKIKGNRTRSQCFNELFLTLGNMHIAPYVSERPLAE